MAEPFDDSKDSIFVTTRWHDIRLFHEEGTAAEAARESVCQTYWYPLYVFLRVDLRKHGADAEQAQDLVQAFFEFVLEKQKFRHADPGDGKFRSFLLAALQNFVTDEWKRSQRQKRRPARGWVSIDDTDAAERFDAEFAQFDSPEKAYDRAWALQILERSLQQVRESYGANSKVFSLMEPLLQGSDGETPYEELAAKAGKTVGAFKVAVHRCRERFQRLVKCAIARTLGWNGSNFEELEVDLGKDEDFKKGFDEEFANLLAALT